MPGHQTHLKPVDSWYDKTHEDHGTKVSKGMRHKPLPEAHAVVLHCSS